MTEQCWVLLGAYDQKDEIWRLRVRRHVSGQPASVEADWRWALDREEEVGDVAGFAHTHPPGSGTEPSERDVRTMEAWCSAFGKALLCLIAEGEMLKDPAAYLFSENGRDTLPAVDLELSEDEDSTND